MANPTPSSTSIPRYVSMFIRAAPTRTVPRYLVAPVTVAVATILRLVLWPAPRTPFLLFYLAVGVAAALSGRVPGVLAAVLSAAVVDHYFLPPVRGWFITPAADLALPLYVCSATALAVLVGSLRNVLFTLWASEEEHRTVGSQLSLAFEIGQSGSFWWDAKKDVNVWSTELLALYGLDPQGFGGRREDWLAALVPEDREAGQQAVERSLKTGEFRLEFRIRRRDSGEIRWMDGRARVFFDRFGQPERMVGINVDITDRKQKEQEHEHTAVLLREADRRKTEFLGVLSHELRNPLSPIRNSVYLLGRAAPGSEQARRALAVIDRQSHQLMRLVDDLLDVTRIERGKIHLQRERLDLQTLVGRVAEDHRELFEKNGVNFQLDLVDEHVPVNADPVRIAQVVGNLLWNAAKFTPRGGSTVLGLRRVDERSAQITVTDTGAGIGPDMLPHLFEPFVQAEQTLHRTAGGLGLGLALVKGLVELHGGIVGVESAGPGHGATFSVRIPVERRKESRIAAVPERAPEALAHRVLLIEDNIDAAQTMKELLELNSHEVEVAYSGPDGLVRARTFRPDVVLCDIGLPGMDGFQVARALREDPELKSVGLVALTGYGQPQDLDASRAAGFDLHLTKPPTLELLEESMSEAYSLALTRAHDSKSA